MTTTVDTRGHEDIPVLQAHAVARYVRISASKARRVIDLIRGLPADQAVDVLRFAPQGASEPVLKVLQSALANAEHNLQLTGAMRVAEAYADEGPTMKRFRPRAQGRAGQIRKRSCHITVVVEPVGEDEQTAQRNQRNRRNR